MPLPCKVSVGPFGGPRRIFTCEFRVQCSVFRVQCPVSSVQCSVSSAQCSVFSVQCSVFSVQCSVLSVQCPVFSVQCSVFSVQCSVFSVQCPVFSVQCPVFRVQEGPVHSVGFKGHFDRIEEDNMFLHRKNLNHCHENQWTELRSPLCGQSSGSRFRVSSFGRRDRAV